MELVLFLVVGLGALLPLVARSDARVRAVALGCAALGALGLVAWDRQADTALERALPERIADTGYTSSHACRSCHPDAYDAWHRSYHRTMTQVASPASVLAKWDGTLEDRGTKVVLSRRGDEYWAEIPDPLWLEDTSPDRPPRPPRIDVRVSMTTGSHHLQNYWARRPAEGEVYAGSFDNGALVQLPWVWLVEEGRWAPVQDSFLTPPTDALEAPNVWNTSCHVCHSVATEPRFDGADFATRSVELGIACEACHGAGRGARAREPLADAPLPRALPQRRRGRSDDREPGAPDAGALRRGLRLVPQLRADPRPRALAEDRRPLPPGRPARRREEGLPPRRRTERPRCSSSTSPSIRTRCRAASGRTERFAWRGAS